MSAGNANVKGLVYRCPVCGAELAVLAFRTGEFRPRCCDRDMMLLRRRLGFYKCPVCGSEIGVVKAGTGVFTPRCCDTPMMQVRAA